MTPRQRRKAKAKRKPVSHPKWTREKERVVRAAVALCNAGGGYCYGVGGGARISDPQLGRRLEHAVADLALAKRGKGKR